MRESIWRLFEPLVLLSHPPRTIFQVPFEDLIRSYNKHAALAASSARCGPPPPADALLMLAEHMLRAQVPLETLARRCEVEINSGHC